MRKSLLLIAVLGTFAVPAMAEELAAAAAEPASPHTFTYNIGLYSQYIFRGLTQTAENAALQGGVDYSHSSGFYLGSWGSNISWLQDAGAYKQSSLEVDVYGGYKNTIGDTGISYDVGALQYLYPGSHRDGFKKADTTELYGALGWKWVSVKYSQSITNAFGFADSRGSGYTEANALVPILDSGFSILAHYGYTNIDGSTAFDYKDWKLGATKSWDNGVNVGGYYTSNDVKQKSSFTDASGQYLAKDQFTFFVQKTF